MMATLHLVQRSFKMSAAPGRRLARSRWRRRAATTGVSPLGDQSAGPPTTCGRLAGPDPHHRGPAAGLHRAPDPRRPGRHRGPCAAQHRRPDPSSRPPRHPLTGRRSPRSTASNQANQPSVPSTEEVAMMTSRAGRPTGPKDAAMTYPATPLKEQGPGRWLQQTRSERCARRSRSRRSDTASSDTRR
jgi:hypothetical protein